MVPHVADRGGSFKGAGLYYLHDKSAKTSDRVAWTYTNNMATNDPHKAMKLMAYVAMNAQGIKHRYDREQKQLSSEYNGRAGSHTTDKPVYAFSLSWHKDDGPDREEMHSAATDVLKLLGLHEHQSVVVAHQDTEEPHVHVICNLVHPETGRVNSASLDHTKLSKWAQEHDREHGRDHCPERIKNNKERAKGQFVKHQPKDHSQAELIQELYNHSDNGQAFHAALEGAGFSMAMGHRGKLMLVENNGQIHTLARQLKNQEGKRIRKAELVSRLKDLDLKSLPNAAELAQERLHFDRDKYAQEQEEKLIDAAIAADQQKEIQEKERQKAGESQTKPDIKKDFKQTDPIYDDSHLRRLDALREWERKAKKKRDELHEKLENFYQMKGYERSIEKLRLQQKEKDSWWGHLTGQYKQISEELENQSKTYENARMRMNEKEQALEKELRFSREQFENSLDNGEYLNQKQARIDEMKGRMENMQRNQNEQGYKRKM